jgi:hypothetical protein
VAIRTPVRPAPWRRDPWLAPFILGGFIERRFAATLPLVRPNERTVIVGVEHVYQAPPAVGDLLGRSVTLLERARQQPSSSDESRMIFFAESWLYGETLALIEINRREPMAAEEGRRQVAEAHARDADRRLALRVEGADAVVVGAVRRTASRPEGEMLPTSEHDPLWWEAEIDVQELEKGEMSRDRTVISFPSSDDDFWLASPKFKPGDKGVFLLRRDQQERGAPAHRVRGLTALDPLDFQPIDRLEAIRSVLRRLG